MDVPLVAQTLETTPFDFVTGAGLAWLNDSMLAVVDRDDQVIVLLDSRARELRRVGRKGHGPGELSTASGVTSDGRGGLWVVQYGGAVHFDATLNAAESIPVPGMITGFRDGGGDSVIAMSTMGVTAPQVWSVDKTTGGRQLLFDPFDVDAELVQNVNGFQNNFVPAVSTVNGDILVAQSLTYRITAFDLTGRVRRVFGRPELEPELRTDRERERLKKSMMRMFQDVPGISTSDMEAAQSTTDAFVDQPKPAFRSLSADGVGRVWVITDRGSGDSTLVDVFDSKGEFLHTVTFAHRVVALSFRLSLVAALVERTDPEFEGYSAIEFYTVEMGTKCAARTER